MKIVIASHPRRHDARMDSSGARKRRWLVSYIPQWTDAIAIADAKGVRRPTPA